MVLAVVLARRRAREDVVRILPEGVSILQDDSGRSRVYRVSGDDRVDGLPLVSVTSVLGVLPKPLTAWAFKKSREWARDYLEAKPGALPDEMHDHLLAQSRAKPEAERGTNVHEAIEAIINGKVVDVEDPALRGWLHWRDRAGVEIVATEAQCYHPKLLYAGTIDAIGVSASGVFLYDWKVSKGAYDSYAAQLAAYAKAVEALTAKPVTGAAVVRLDPATGEAEEHPVNIATGWDLFVSALALRSALAAPLYGAAEPF